MSGEESFCKSLRCPYYAGIFGCTRAFLSVCVSLLSLDVKPIFHTGSPQLRILIWTSNYTNMQSDKSHDMTVLSNWKETRLLNFTPSTFVCLLKALRPFEMLGFLLTALYMWKAMHFLLLMCRTNNLLSCNPFPISLL